MTSCGQEESTDSFDNDDFGMPQKGEFKVSNSVSEQPNVSKVLSPLYSILTTGEVEDLMKEKCKEIEKKLNVAPEDAEISLKIKGYDSIKAEKLAKSFTPSNKNYFPFLSSIKSNKSNSECRICYDQIQDKNKMAALACNHFFCLDCWRDYVLNECSLKGIKAAKTKCPHNVCGRIAPDSFISNLFKHAGKEGDKALQKYKKFCLDFFVESQKDIINCVNPLCGRFYVKKRDVITFGQCHCGINFCFECAVESHKPATCQNIKEWSLKHLSDSGSIQYISLFTKSCPRCNVRIEKIFGCNHMKCFSCDYNFCWICLGDWKEHGKITGGYYKCNTFIKDVKKKTESKNQKTEASRHLFFNMRYKSHEHSLQFAQKTLNSVKNKVVFLRKKDKESSWSDFNYLIKAIEVVKNCRKILMNSYVYLYFEKEGPKTELFRFLQEDLERQTEILHELVEKPTEELDKSTIITQTALAEKYAENILK